MKDDFVLTTYIDEALSTAEYDKLDDGSFGGRIPLCHGVVAFGSTLRECESRLHSTLEDWLLVGLKLGHSIPILGGIDLNRQPERVTADTV